MGRYKAWSSAGINFGPIVVPFLHMIYPQLSTIYQYCMQMILVTRPNKNDFQINITAAFNCINEWLNANLLSLNFNKTHCIQFTTNNKPNTNIKISYDNKQITTISNIKFLGIIITDTINWKYHIGHILPQLSVVCYVMRSIKPYMSLNNL